jgi:hypothetical protein
MNLIEEPPSRISVLARGRVQGAPARDLRIDFDRLDQEKQTESIENFVEKHHEELFLTSAT